MTPVPTRLVWMKAAGPSIERSTWLSAARFITQFGRKLSSAARAAVGSQMSAWMNE